MPSQQGSLDLLSDPVAQSLFTSTNPARLAYSALDGTPRVVPVWFHWDGRQVVFGTPVGAPKVAALRANPSVAVTIDGNEFPYPVLLLRGRAQAVDWDGMVPEYAAAAERYLGAEGGQGWLAQVGSLGLKLLRVAITPEWAAVMDFQQRFPGRVQAAIEAATPA